MIYGIGIDATSVSRITKSLQSPSFITKCFGEKEVELYNARNQSAQTLAVCFAAKEALFKAIGTGLFVYNMREIQLLRKENGEPFFELCGKLEEFFSSNNLKAFVSATHEKDLAIVNVVIEKT